ncbi:MAG: hypothetical protein AAF653_06820, partial [Chloroflexota bacterium]
DHASSHHRRAAQAAPRLSDDRIRVDGLPQSSPFRTPIERFWLHFKQLATANHLHRSIEALAQTVQEVMKNQNTFGHANRLILSHNFRSVA